MGLVLDDAHTLVIVEPKDLEALWLADIAGALGWLLFRSPAVVPSAGRAGNSAPELWFELGGRRLFAELREGAGWEEPGTAAVALFELRVEGLPAKPEGPSWSRCGLVVEGGEIAVELPGSWRERLGLAPGE